MNLRSESLVTSGLVRSARLVSVMMIVLGWAKVAGAMLRLRPTVAPTLGDQDRL